MNKLKIQYVKIIEDSEVMSILMLKRLARCFDVSIF